MDEPKTEKPKWEFGKEPIVKQEWVIRRGSFIIPINTSVNTIMLFLIMALAYNYGHNDAYEIMRWTAYFSNEGMYNPDTGTYLKCWPTTDMNRVNWECEEQNTTFNSGLNYTIQRFGS